jgi:hypothetical protein
MGILVVEGARQLPVAGGGNLVAVVGLVFAPNVLDVVGAVDAFGVVIVGVRGCRRGALGTRALCHKLGVDDAAAIDGEDTLDEDVIATEAFLAGGDELDSGKSSLGGEGPVAYASTDDCSISASAARSSSDGPS